jgi:DNA-binding NtrC family response regulator
LRPQNADGVSTPPPDGAATTPPIEDACVGSAPCGDGSEFVTLIGETSEELILRVAFSTKLDPVREVVDAIVIRFILTRVLAQSHGNVTRTAQLVGLSRKTMQTYMKDYLSRESLDD